MKNLHQRMVEQFLRMMGIRVPTRPQKMMSKELRIHHAKMIFEEAMETINDGLGIAVMFGCCDDTYEIDEHVDFQLKGDYDPVETIDGCCDLHYVATGCMCTIGVPQQLFQTEVDTNNLLKFGGDGHRDDHGKWIKPTDHPNPNVERLFRALLRDV